MDPNNQNVGQPQQATEQAQAPVQTPVSKFKADPVQTTLQTGTKVLSFAAMITSFIALFKRFWPKK